MKKNPKQINKQHEWILEKKVWFEPATSCILRKRSTTWAIEL